MDREDRTKVKSKVKIFLKREFKKLQMVQLEIEGHRKDPKIQHKTQI